MAVTTHNARPSVYAIVALVALIGVLGGVAVFNAGRAGASSPHIDHVTLPAHRTWQIVSVQPYEGLEEIELVKFDWPTPEDAHLAFALSREGLKVGDQICLDHVREIDTFWAHPVPAGGCASRQPARR